MDVNDSLYQPELYQRHYTGSPAPTLPHDEQLKSTACTPNMSNFNQRLNTFHDWNRNIKATPQQIAHAGFFHVNGTRDDTKCFYCNGGLRNWEIEDDPWAEHAKWYPHCRYINIAKEAAQRQDTIPLDIPPPPQRFPGYDIPPQSCNFQSTSPLQSNAAGNLPIAAADGCATNRPRHNVDHIMSSSTIKNVMNFGYTEEIVKPAVEIAIAKNLNVESVFDLVEICMEIEEDGIDKVKSKYAHNQVGTTEMMYDQPPTNIALADANNKDRPTNNISNIQPDDIKLSIPGTTTNSTSTLLGAEGNDEEKYKEMHEDKMCKVCLSKERNCLFLPCGHLCCCVDCSSALKTCPLCRVKLTEIRRIYF